MWVREVILSVDGTPFVAAHNIAPLAASKGVWQAMRRLRTRPLAELLYSDPQVERSALVSRRVIAGHPLYALATHALDGARAPHSFAARSVFQRHGKPLMVTECMLPALAPSRCARRRAALRRAGRRRVMLRGFPPVVAANTHTMILGSFPGEASLDAAQYYAHPRNQFWRLLGTVLGEHGLH